VVVYVPETTPTRVRGLLEAYGASVVVIGSQWSEANEAAMKRVASASEKAAMIHPFEGEDTWKGHSTLVDEIAEDLRAYGGGKWMSPCALVTCVGGGGLLAGCVIGIERNGWKDDVVIVAMETLGAESMFASIQAGKVVTLPGITSIAKSLGAASPSVKVFEKCIELGPERLRSRTCTDAHAVEASVRFADDHRILVEPACGAALSAVYVPSLGALDGLPDDGRPVVVVVCGGSVVDRSSLDALATQYL
jgi:L-serine/L-threonine ammonia-lyase